MTWTVYRAYGADAATLYVGQTRDMARRAREHGQASSWWSECAGLDAQNFATRSEAVAEERRLIAELQPPHNRYAGIQNLSHTTPTTVEVNGFALRELRVRSGIGVAELAAQVGVQRAYVAKIELGYSQRVSPKVFKQLLSALSIADRRALLAHPHGVAAEVAS